VGLFILVVLVLLGGLVVMFGGVPTWLKRHRTYIVVLADAGGVAPGTPVRRSGVRIGEVQAVNLDEATGRVRTQISIEHPHILHRSDRVALNRSLLGGDATVDFDAEPPQDVAEQPPAEPGTEFVAQQAPGKAPPGMPQIELIPGMQSTMKELNKS